MKKFLKYTTICILSLALVGCTAVQNSNKTQKGAVVGAAGGALLGGLIGGNLKGALIGAAIGGTSGAVIGNVMDKQAQKIETAVPGAEVERIGEGILINFDENSGVTFATNKADLTANSKANLDKVINVFLEFPDTNLLVQGHTDSTGSAEYNMELSKKRANSVVDYLTSKGVAANRLSKEGLGQTMPRFDNATAEGRSKNRRVEIAVTANEQMIEDARARQN